MVFILRERRDESAKKVILWLKKLKIPFLDLPEQDAIDLISNVKITNNDVAIYFNHEGKEYNLCDFKVIWFRRAHFQFKLPKPKLKDSKNKEILSLIDIHLNQELETLNTFIYKYLRETSVVINDPLAYNYNKLLGLINAKKAGLKIPETLLTTKAEDVLRFKVNNDKIVTKNIQDVFTYSDYRNKVSWMQSTKSVDCNKLPISFFYSLFQNDINKVYEIRTFVFMDKQYSIAMFTQSSPSTKDDSRLVDKTKMIRFVPYTLPEDIEKSIFKFMNLSGLLTGSIDIIFNGSDYYFLEINPVGQFDYVSGYGNYSIEKSIALEFKKILAQ